MVSAWPVWPSAKVSALPCAKLRPPVMALAVLWVNVTCPPPATVIGALIARSPNELSTSALLPVSVTGAATVSRPAVVWTPNPAVRFSAWSSVKPATLVAR